MMLDYALSYVLSTTTSRQHTLQGEPFLLVAEGNDCVEFGVDPCVLRLVVLEWCEASLVEHASVPCGVCQEVGVDD